MAGERNQNQQLQTVTMLSYLTMEVIRKMKSEARVWCHDDLSMSSYQPDLVEVLDTLAGRQTPT